MKKVPLKTLQQFQEAFDKVLWHLIRMKKRSYNFDTGICCYRAPNKSKCAIGCLIPDELYEPKFDNGQGVVGLRTVLRKVFSGKYIYELTRLQEIHDEECYWHPDFGFNDEGIREIVKFAEKTSLKINENAIKSWVRKQEKQTLSNDQKLMISTLLRKIHQHNTPFPTKVI